MINYIEPNPILVKPLDNFCLYIKFADGKEKVYNMSKLIQENSAYKKLQNYEYFKLVKLAGETVEWPNGEDVCPENLYYDSIEYLK